MLQGRVLVVAALLLNLLGLTACQTVAADPEGLLLSRAQATEFSSRTSYGSYAIRPSDQLKIQVYDDQNITGEYQVDSGGYISMPLAGRIKASGLTPAQLERAIKAKLTNGVLTNPDVAVQVLAYGPIYVHGEVKRGGEFPYRPGLTVMDAVALAGGYTYRADESAAFVTRAGSQVERGHALDHSVRIYPGDNIRIPERFF
ncbi:MAG: polysaccharide biosynthesis/export protein [Betaproteobacteria bacterium]|jgi:polysaccharide export outer membrane protein